MLNLHKAKFLHKENSLVWKCPGKETRGHIGTRRFPGARICTGQLEINSIHG